MKKTITLLLALLLLSSCAVKQPLATVGGIKITEGEFAFYLSNIKKQMSDTELQTDEDWQTKEIEGKRAIDVAKQKAMDQAIKNAEYYEIGKKVGIKLSEDDKKKVTSTKEQVVSSYGGSKAYKEFLKTNKITDRFVDMMCNSTIYHSKLIEMLDKEQPVTDAQRYTYYENNKFDIEAVYRKAKHILILTVDSETRQPKSESEIKDAEKKAQQIFERAKHGEDFDTLMNTYSEDPGLKTSPNGYVFKSGEMVEEFEKATDSVKPGEITFAKSSYGYHIIRREQLQYNDVENDVASMLLEERLTSKIDEWMKKYNLKLVKNDELINNFE